MENEKKFRFTKCSTENNNPMNPIHFKQSNYQFGKPADMTDEQCGSLPVYKGHTTDGFPAIVSCWEVTPEDLARIQASGRIWLTVMGHNHPVVSLSSETLFDENI